MSNITFYDIGDTVRSSVLFTDENDALTDPTTVTVKWKILEIVETKVYGVDEEVKKDSVGSYYIDILAEDPEPHYMRWTGVGGINVAEESTFYVQRSNVI